MNDVTFDEYVKQKVEEEVYYGNIINVVIANNFMFEYGIDSSLGHIYRDRKCSYNMSGNDRYNISDNYIRENFNKETYINLVLDNFDIFDIDKTTFCQKYKKDILCEVWNICTFDSMRKDRRVKDTVKQIVDNIIMEKDVLFISLLNNTMIKQGVNTRIGYIHIDGDSLYVGLTNDIKCRRFIDTEYICNNFNKEGLVKLILDENKAIYNILKSYYNNTLKIYLCDFD